MNLSFMLQMVQMAKDVRKALAGEAVDDEGTVLLCIWQEYGERRVGEERRRGCFTRFSKRGATALFLVNKIEKR